MRSACYFDVEELELYNIVNLYTIYTYKTHLQLPFELAKYFKQMEREIPIFPQ